MSESSFDMAYVFVCVERAGKFASSGGSRIRLNFFQLLIWTCFIAVMLLRLSSEYYYSLKEGDSRWCSGHHQKYVTYPRIL